MYLIHISLCLVQLLMTIMGTITTLDDKRWKTGDAVQGKFITAQGVATIQSTVPEHIERLKELFNAPCTRRTSAVALFDISAGDNNKIWINPM